MSMLSVIHNDVQIRDGPVTVLRDVERNVERDADCYVVRNVLRNTIRLTRRKRLTRVKYGAFHLNGSGPAPGGHRLMKDSMGREKGTGYWES